MGNLISGEINMIDSKKTWRWIRPSMAIVWCLSLCSCLDATLLVVDGHSVPLIAEAGDGSQISYLLIDFGGAKPPGGKYAFAYHYDGAKTGEDLLTQIDLSVELLTIDYQDFGDLGSFVSGITMDQDTDTPDFGVDQRYWVYWQGEYRSANGGSVQWKVADDGIRQRQLTANSIDGWYASDGSIAPSFPLSTLITDLNQDGSVDAGDAGIMFADWGADFSPADFNLDLVVDAADAQLMFEQWTGDANPTVALPEPTQGTGGALVAILAILGRVVNSRRASAAIV